MLWDSLYEMRPEQSIAIAFCSLSKSINRLSTISSSSSDSIFFLSTHPYSEPDQSSSCPSSHFFTIHFNIILPPIPRSTKLSLSLRFFRQIPVCPCPLHHTCYMLRPSGHVLNCLKISGFLRSAQPNAVSRSVYRYNDACSLRSPLYFPSEIYRFCL